MSEQQPSGNIAKVKTGEHFRTLTDIVKKDGILAALKHDLNVISQEELDSLERGREKDFAQPDLDDDYINPDAEEFNRRYEE